MSLINIMLIIQEVMTEDNYCRSVVTLRCVMIVIITIINKIIITLSINILIECKILLIIEKSNRRVVML